MKISKIKIKTFFYATILFFGRSSSLAKVEYIEQIDWHIRQLKMWLATRRVFSVVGVEKSAICG